MMELGCFIVGVAAIAAIAAAALAAWGRYHPWLVVGAVVLAVGLVFLVQWWLLRVYWHGRQSGGDG